MSTLACSVVALLVLSLSMSMDVLGEKITVFNNLGDFVYLTVHCHSNDHDVGSENLAYGARYQFTTQSDSYNCDLTWVSRSGTFTLYQKSVDDTRCPDAWCFWRVDQDGLYLHLSNPDRYDLEYKWP